MKSFWMGLAGSFVGIMLLTGMAFWADIFKVDQNGAIRFGVSDKGEIAINTDATATQAGLTFSGVSTVTGDIRLSGRGSAPSGPGAGDMWYESTPKEVKYFDGGLTKPLATMTNGALTLYVDAARPDDTGDGLTSGTAKKYIQSAVNLVPPIVRHAVTINVAAGTYRDVGATIGSDTVNVYVADKVVTPSGSITFQGSTTLAGASGFRVTGSNAGAETTPVRTYGFRIQEVLRVHIRGFQCDYFLNDGILYLNRASGTPLNCVSSNNKRAGIYYSYSFGSPTTCTANSNGVGAGALWPQSGIVYESYSTGSPNTCTANSNGLIGIVYTVMSQGDPYMCTANSNTAYGVSYSHQSEGSPSSCSLSSNSTGIWYDNSNGFPPNNTSTSNNTNYGIYSDQGSMVDYSGTTPGGNTAATGANAANYARIF